MPKLSELLNFGLNEHDKIFLSLIKPKNTFKLIKFIP